MRQKQDPRQLVTWWRSSSSAFICPLRNIDFFHPFPSFYILCLLELSIFRYRPAIFSRVCLRYVSSVLVANVLLSSSCHDSIWQHAQLIAICSTRFIHHNIIMMEVQEMKIVRRITEKSLRNMLRSEALRRKYQIDKINDLVFGEKFSGMII